jgi:hypothetical protein
MEFDNIVIFIKQNFIYVLGFAIILVLYITYPLYSKIFKPKKSIKKESNFDNTISNMKFEAKKKAIEVLHSFGISYIEKDIAGSKKMVNLSITNPDNVSDDDVIMAFSRLSDEVTTFQSDWTRPEGVAGKNETTPIDGMIWGLVFAPDFIKMVVPHSKFIKIWKDERERKLEMENFIRGIDMEKIRDEIFANDSYIVTIDNGKYVDYDKFFELYKELYEKYIYEKFRIKLPNPFNFYDIIAIHFGYPNLLAFDRNAELITLDNSIKKITKIKKF